MGTLNPCRAVGALLFVLVRVAHALPSVPIATDPILSTATVSTVVPSLVTIYSVVTATDAGGAVQTLTTTVNGQETIVATSDSVGGGLVTNTIISTVSLPTDVVVVSTVDYSTILGPDPVTTTTDPATAAPTIAEATPVAAPATTIQTPVEPSSTSVAAIVASTTSAATSDPQSASSTPSTTSSESTSSSQSRTLSTASTTSPGSSISSSSSTSTSQGLSTGAKAGIGVGVAIAVIILVFVAFLLGRRYSQRRNSSANKTYDSSRPPDAEEKNVFQAGLPYEHTGSRRHYGGAPGKGHYVSDLTIEAESESSGRSHKGVGLHSATGQPDATGISALPQVEENDQMYIGVPSHMSGSKRWSMKEYEK
ncbi:hypothetical protein A1O1_03152 [Capronia coronata CBS 617.96]|uniref:Mid2 domain-containing protein n=1 Tax=Capronia coronata CBS 617.96 TaxID=1182541 RepID=W9ZJP5_9EURO|nr:uncharacterized protein A1O1_03152 [Capronia coronata CBS 617.96]EXJ94754.1 hypothetical protein A1O1_03152 [Capronia coronata CBS 617.96]